MPTSSQPAPPKGVSRLIVTEYARIDDTLGRDLTVAAIRMHGVNKANHHTQPAIGTIRWTRSKGQSPDWNVLMDGCHAAAAEVASKVKDARAPFDTQAQALALSDGIRPVVEDWETLGTTLAHEACAAAINARADQYGAGL